MQHALNTSSGLADAQDELRRETARREQAEERLRLFVEHAPAAIAMFDRDMRYLAVSRRWLTDFNLQGDVLGRSHYDVFPEIPDRWRDVHRRGLRGEVLKADEDPFRRDDGSTQWLRWEVRPWHTHGGEVGGIVIFAEDVTQRRGMEDALRESEARFRQLAESIPQLAWMAQPDGHITWYNRRWYDYTGATLEQMRGWGWQAVHDPATLPAVMQRWQASLQTGEPFDMVFPLRGKDGTFRPFLTRVMPLKDEAGRILHWFGTNTDVGDIKEKEEALRLLGDTASYLLTVNDSHAFVKRVYERLKAHLNLDVCFNYLAVEGAPRMRLDFYDGIPADVAERIRHLEHGQAVCGCVAVQQRKIVAEDIAHSSDERTALVRGFGVQAYVCHPLLVQGQFIGTLSFGTKTRPHFTDEELALMEAVASQVAAAMERLRLIGALRQRADELAEANRRKDEFLAMLGHELRNPLAAIRNGLHVLLLSQGADDAVGQVKAMMDKQVNNLTRMVDDLLDVSRITRGMVQLRKEKVVVATVVSHAVESVRPLVEAQHHTLTVLPAPRPVRVEADPTRLEQVLVNLLTNAAKYTKQGGYITLTVERAGGEAVIRVRDNGVGIRPDLLPKVFEPFVQSERSLDRSQGGLGIGLTLVRSLVEMHGGRVEAHSEGLNKGSEFVVRLPALPDEQEGPAAPPEPAAAANGKARVLVVEDTPDVAKTLRLLLELWGYDVRVAEDGPSALVAYRTYQPDVVLLDIGLPGMNGYDVARQLRRENGRKRPFLMAVTGYGQDEDRQRAHEAGFDLHMTKPVDPGRLQTVLAGQCPTRA